MLLWCSGCWCSFLSEFQLESCSEALLVLYVGDWIAALVYKVKDFTVCLFFLFFCRGKKIKMWIRHAMSVFHWNLKDVHSCLYNKVLLKHDGPEERLFLHWSTWEQRMNPPELVELVSHHHCWTVTVSAGLRLPLGCESKQRRRVINYTLIEKCVSIFREVSLCWLSHWKPPSINTVWRLSRRRIRCSGATKKKINFNVVATMTHVTSSKVVMMMSEGTQLA